MVCLGLALRGGIFGCSNSYFADDHGLLGSVPLRVFLVVTHRERKDPAGDVEALGHFPEDGKMAIQERGLVEGDIEAAGGGVRLLSVGGADGARFVRLLGE